MFKLRNLQWPMDCDQAMNTLAQQSDVKAQNSEEIDRSSRSPPEQSTSNQQSIDESKSTVENGIETILENKFVDNKRLSNTKLKSQIRNMKKRLQKDKRKGTKTEDDIEQKQEKLTELREQLNTRREEKKAKEKRRKKQDRNLMRKQKEMQKIGLENGENTTAKKTQRHKSKTPKEKSEQSVPSNSINDE